MSIILSHPHANTVANGTAAAFARANTLAAYLTGATAVEGTWRAEMLHGISPRLRVVRNRLLRGIRPDQLRSLTSTELSARALALAAKRLGFSGPSVYDAIYTAHDAVVSLMPWPREADTVYAYEDGALRTFRRAQRRGLRRVWDLPTPHYRTHEKMWIDETLRWPGSMGVRPPTEPPWKQRRKDAEMHLADVIVVPSVFTAESVAAVDATATIVTVPFGFPVEDFQPKPQGQPLDKPFVAIAVGSQDLRKGTPYLLEAWRAAGLKDAKLRLIGPMRLTPSFLTRYAGIYEHVPPMPRADLAREYERADVLLLPTLGDGCPQVMQEAMCCATPVVTTRCGSGPDLITHGRDGWLIPERDVEALASLIRTLAADRERTRAVGRAARQRAEAWTWLQSGMALTDGLTRALRGVLH